MMCLWPCSSRARAKDPEPGDRNIHIIYIGIYIYSEKDVCINACFPCKPLFLMESGCFRHAGLFYEVKTTWGSNWSRHKNYWILFNGDV